MTLLGIHPDKLIDSLLTLPKEKDLREGVFSLTVKEEDRPGATITLAIQPSAGALLQVPESEAAQATLSICTYHTTSYFLRECHTTLFAKNQGLERQLIISGASVPQDTHWLDICVAVKLANVSAAGVEAELGDLFSHLAELDVGHGLLLTGIFHSHLWTGRGAVNPSEKDRRLQENLEKSGYKTVQAIFSQDQDPYIGFFTNTTPFRLNVIGNGVEEMETHDHQTVVRLVETFPHLSHQTL
jgi:hypothetical protein